MAGIAQTATLGPYPLLAALAAWTLVPLGLAALAFSRREL
jgi:Cu-processing system permease protein